MLNIFYYNGTITNQGILKSYRNENRFRTIQFGNIWSFSSCSWNFLATGRILIWNSRTSAVNGKIADNTMLVIFISHRKPLQKHVFFEDLDRARFTVDIGHFQARQWRSESTSKCAMGNLAMTVKNLLNQDKLSSSISKNKTVTLLLRANKQVPPNRTR